ncbi:MAG: AI-2E family transporter [Blautia sp.]|nr:AI-2E family transporter [Blautia sp.]MDY4515864.1 AI-2E family transporter [Lachnospiraceae bacterium]
MEIKIKNKRSLLIIITCGILFYWGLNHLSVFLGILKQLLGVVSPFLMGGAIAFVLNVPMKNIEKRLLSVFKEKKMLLRAVSILASFLLALGIVVFVVMMVIPALIDTLVQLNAGIPRFLDNVNEWLLTLTKDYPEITDYLMSIELNWTDITQKAMAFLQNSAAGLLRSTWGMASSVIGGITTAAIGLIFSVYILAEKEKLGMQFKKIIYAYLPEHVVAHILKVSRLSAKTFSGFISGQCTEAVAFGLLCYLAMTIFDFPYAVCVSVLIGFMTLLPVVGAFLGTALGAILIMVSSPVKAIWFVVMIIILQQIDGNLIYPRIVGSSVGLPSMWVLVAVTVGGSLMGVFGMLVFVPLVSVLYALFRENVYKNLHKKAITQEKLER